MLGRKILDPHGMESRHIETAGMGLLDVETLLERTKVTAQVEANLNAGSWGMGQGSEKGNASLKGYEIHMGSTTGDVGLFEIQRMPADSELRMQELDKVLDGSRKEKIWGTYIHGIFDNDPFRRNLINALRAARGLAAIDVQTDFAEAREQALNRWAGVLKETLDMKAIDDLING